MKQLTLAESILFHFSLLFLALSISPNYTETSILRSLISMPIPFALVFWVFERGRVLKLIVSALSILYLYFTLGVEWPVLFFISAITIPILFYVHEKWRDFYWILSGGFFFYLVYLNINTYDFGHLFYGFQYLTVLFAFFHFAAMKKNTPALLLANVPVVIYYIMTGHLDFGLYLVVLTMVQIAAFYSKYYENTLVPILFSVTYISFFVSYLLFGTHLIQALQGGF